jgi:hypothetical protein
MSPVLQELLVAVLVAAAAVYSAWRLAPLPLRLKLLDLATPLLGTVATAPLTRLRARTLAQLVAGGCSACAGAARHRSIAKR